MKSIICLFILVSNIAIAKDYPAQQINRVDSVHFGQPQVEIERLLGLKAKSVDDSGIGRPEKDTFIIARGSKLDFDTGRLVNITFDADFGFASAIAAFPETWRNFEPIGKLRLKKGIMKADFMEYFRAWEARAKQSDVRRNEGNDLLQEGEYRVSITEDEFIDMIHVSFGPERSTGKGGSWGSGCSISFVTPAFANLDGRKAGVLDSISVLCDEFNTHARHTSEKNEVSESAPSAAH